MRRGVVIGVGVVVVITMLSFSPILLRALSNPAGADPVAINSVGVVNTSFDPAAVTVSVGDAVTWTFQDGDDEHNVVFEDGDSSKVQSSGTWSRTFDTPGEYAYSCTLHAFMDGRVVVGG